MEGRSNWSCSTRSPAETSGQIYIVGAGGIGCAVGYALISGGLDVTFVEVDRQKLEWGSRNGIGLDNRSLLSAKFVCFEEWKPSDTCVVILCTKCFENASILQRLPESVGVMPIQNGFDSELMERSTLEGIASFVSECFPGRTQTRITRRGDLHIGQWGKDNEREILGEFIRVLDVLKKSGDFNVKTVPNVLPYKYSKVMYNAAISPLAAMAGLDNGELLTIRKARDLFFRILQENYGILKAAGVPLGVIGPFHPDTVNRILHYPFLAKIMAKPFAYSLRNTYCSMAGDIEKGRTEIDFFNGHLIELAGDREIPFNRSIFDFLKWMEKTRQAPSLDLLDTLIEITRIGIEIRE